MRLIKVTLAATTVAIGAVGSMPSALAEDNPQTVAEFTGAVNEMVGKHNLAPVPVVVETPSTGSPNTVAETSASGDRIKLNPVWAAMPPEEFQYRLQAHFEPNNVYSPGCGSIRGSAIHEVGHVIEHRKNAAPRQVLHQAVVNREILNDGLPLGSFIGLDPKGPMNYPETLAIAFQAVECGTPTPTQYKIYDMLVN